MSKIASLLAILGIVSADSQFDPEPINGLEAGFCPIAPKTQGDSFEPDKMEGHWYVIQIDKWGAAY